MWNMKYVEPETIRPHMSIVRAVSTPYETNSGTVACHTQTPHRIPIDVRMYLSCTPQLSLAIHPRVGALNTTEIWGLNRHSAQKKDCGEKSFNNVCKIQRAA